MPDLGGFVGSLGVGGDTADEHGGQRGGQTGDGDETAHVRETFRQGRAERVGVPPFNSRTTAEDTPERSSRSGTPAPGPGTEGAPLGRHPGQWVVCWR
ncbi:hypothetical protein GCM10022245_70940 [Streptomyces mayteni]